MFTSITITCAPDDISGCLQVLLFSAAAHAFNCMSPLSYQACFLVDYGGIVLFGVTAGLVSDMYLCPHSCITSFAGVSKCSFLTLISCLFSFSKFGCELVIYLIWSNYFIYFIDLGTVFLLLKILLVFRGKKTHFNILFQVCRLSYMPSLPYSWAMLPTQSVAIPDIQNVTLSSSNVTALLLFYLFSSVFPAFLGKFITPSTYIPSNIRTF